MPHVGGPAAGVARAAHAGLMGPLGRGKQEAAEDKTDAHRRRHEGYRVAPCKAFETAGQLAPRTIPKRVREPGNLIGGLVRVLHQPTSAGRFERLCRAAQRIADRGDLIGGTRALGVDQRYRAVARRADQLRADLFSVAHRVPAQFDVVVAIATLALVALPLTLALLARSLLSLSLLVLLTLSRPLPLLLGLRPLPLVRALVCGCRRRARRRGRGRRCRGRA